MISIQQVNETQITGKIQLMRELVKKGLIDPDLGTLPKQAQLLTEHCMGLTPPRNNKDRLTGIKMSKSHKDAGESAVARDINRVIAARNPAYLESVIRITGAVDNVRQALRNKNGVTYLIDVDRINEDGSEMAAWHQRARDSRGRITLNQREVKTPIGRWKAHNRLWVPPGSLVRFRKQKQALVGWAKAGWMKAYNALKGTRSAEWVIRHGSMRGVFVNGLSAQRPFIQVGNDTGWGRSNGAKQVVENSMRGRERAMQTYFNTTMRLAAEGTPTTWQVKMRAVAAQEQIAA